MAHARNKQDAPSEGVPQDRCRPQIFPEETAPAADAASAFARVQEEIAALDTSHLVAINTDIPTAVSIVLGALPAVSLLRDDIVEQLPRFPIGTVDKLETYALAAWYAHVVALPAPAGNRQIKDLLEQAVPLRATLLSDAEALARRGLVLAEAVADIRAGQGHIDTVNDLVALSALFSTSWPEIRGKTAATEEEVRQASVLGPQPLAALGVRDQGRITPDEAVERRARAFWLLVRAYDQLRRAVDCLRWDEGDADSLAPSLYKGRGGRPSADTGSATLPAVPEVVPAAAWAPGTPAAPAAPQTGPEGSPPA